MFKKNHEYHKYCQCITSLDKSEIMCEFCKRYSKLRYYQSMWNRNKIETNSGMDKTLSDLRTWFYNTTGRAFESPGRGKKPYLKEKQEPEEVEIIDNRSKDITKEEILNRITPDTFIYKNNTIVIKDTRDVSILMINLETRQIIDLCSKYKVDSKDLHDMENLKDKLIKIKKILEE